MNGPGIFDLRPPLAPGGVVFAVANGPIATQTPMNIMWQYLADLVQIHGAINGLVTDVHPRIHRVVQPQPASDLFRGPIPL